MKKKKSKIKTLNIFELTDDVKKHYQEVFTRKTNEHIAKIKKKAKALRAKKEKMEISLTPQQKRTWQTVHKNIKKSNINIFKWEPISKAKRVKPIFDTGNLINSINKKKYDFKVHPENLALYRRLYQMGLSEQVIQKQIENIQKETEEEVDKHFFGKRKRKIIRSKKLKEIKEKKKMENQMTDNEYEAILELDKGDFFLSEWELGFLESMLKMTTRRRVLSVAQRKKLNQLCEKYLKENIAGDPI